MTSPPSAEMARARPVEEVMVTSLDGEHRAQRPDLVAGEEPLEIRVGAPGAPASTVAVTMRTPGSDFELAVGFLLTEGILRSPDDVRAVRYCELSEDDVQRYNVVTVDTLDTLAAAAVDEHRRNVTVSASCGVCGTASLEQLRGRCPAVPEGAPVSAGVLTALPSRLRDAQRVFARTGGLHAAGLFTTDGQLLAAREDIGRHNAVDKLIGWAALDGRLPLRGAVLVVSGRTSFEIVQKAAIGGIPFVAGVSAPSSLAVATARGIGMTLAGFVRDGRANVYSAPWRVAEDEAGAEAVAES